MPYFVISPHLCECRPFQFKHPLLVGVGFSGCAGLKYIPAFAPSQVLDQLECINISRCGCLTKAPVNASSVSYISISMKAFFPRKRIFVVMCIIELCMHMCKIVYGPQLASFSFPRLATYGDCSKYSSQVESGFSQKSLSCSFLERSRGNVSCRCFA